MLRYEKSIVLYTNEILFLYACQKAIEEREVIVLLVYMNDVVCEFGKKRRKNIDGSEWILTSFFTEYLK